MKKKIIAVCISLCLLFAYSHAQDTTYSLKISCQKNITGDTIWLTVTNPVDHRPGTLLVIAYQTTVSKTDSFYLPVLNTTNYYGIVIPSNYQRGKLKLRASFYPKIFAVSGMVLNKTNSEQINALVITKNQKIYNKSLKLTEDKEFNLPGLIFENKASLIFNYSLANKKDKPNIIIEQTPTLKDFTDTVFSTEIVLQEDAAVAAVTATDTTTTTKVNGKKNNNAKEKDKSVLLKEVVVTAQKKSKAEKFNEEFSTGLFNDQDETIIDCLSNNNILSFPDCLSFLRSQIPGLTSYNDNFGESGLRWRGKDMQAFYINEIEVDINQILSINVADIAIVKAYPPPFFGASAGTGDGGAIAIYTRVGEYKREDTSPNKWLFSIKGYSPAIHTLFDGK